MGTYKAQPNNMEGVDEEKAQEARNEAATEDTLNAALDVAEKIPVAAGYAKAAKLVNKATGGALTKGASKVVTKGLKQSPMGDQIQGAMNNASESGLTSAVSSAANMSGGSGGAKGGGLAQAGGAAKAAKGSSSPLNGMGSIGGMGGGLMGNKVKLYVMLYGGIAFFAFIIIMSIFSDPNETTLSLTNQEELTFTSNGTRVCTEEEIENKMIYVGDKRVNGINTTLNNDKITYIYSETADLNWWNSTGITEIENTLNADPTKVVVISLGLYDLNNIDSYINTYNDLINKYPNQIFISSINPVDETKTTAYSNIDIENFNKKLSDNFKSNYIDTYSTTTTLNSVDGITYDNTTYESIHKNLVSDLKNSEKISCSTGLSNIVYYNQNDYTESYGYGTTIKSDGCGPVAMAMIISTLTDKKVTPIETAKYSLDNGYRTNGGTSTDFITAIATEHGIKTETLTLDQESITNALSQSKPILMIVGPGNFTSRNHYIILTGISEDGKVTIADPLSLEKSNQLWEMSTIINEGTGSLWAFSI